AHHDSRTAPIRAPWRGFRGPPGDRPHRQHRRHRNFERRTLEFLQKRLPGRGEDASMNANLSVALEMAAAGIAVFPMLLFKDGSGKWRKKPAIKGWRTKATKDVEIIKRWGREFPQAVFAIELEMAGLVVIDCDRHREDADGVMAIKELVEANGAGFP